MKYKTLKPISFFDTVYEEGKIIDISKFDDTTLAEKVAKSYVKYKLIEKYEVKRGRKKND